MPQIYRRAIEYALRWAWMQVLSEHPEIIESGDEEHITNRLQTTLNEFGPDHKRLAPGLDLFDTVERGAKVVANDESLGKAPDLTFRPPPVHGVRNLGSWGLFVECKIIDGAANHSPRAYCEHGVARFVAGEYAARMSSGMMLAYVRDDRLPYPTLSPILAAPPYKTLSQESVAEDVSQSVHERTGLAPPCANIDLTHLWLSVPVLIPRPKA
jgi:hypothetical protein